LLDFEDVLVTYKSKQRGSIALAGYRNWFPLKPSEKIAGIVADLMGDGHLQDSPKYRLDFSSKSTEELNRFNNEIYDLFGVKGKIRDCKTNKYNTKNLGINNKPLARVLKQIGVPTGAKVFTSFPIPNWILQDKKLFARFINRLFSCEGCVDVKSRAIELKMYKTVEKVNDGIFFFNQMKTYLEKYYDIKSTKPFLEGSISTRKDGRKTQGIRIKIKNKQSLVKFGQFVCFDEKNKQMKLETIIKVISSLSKQEKTSI